MATNTFESSKDAGVGPGVDRGFEALDLDAERIETTIPKMTTDPQDDGMVDVEPLTMGMLARYFAVPLVIIGSIVGGAALVVSLFGAPSSPQERSIEQLMQSLEASDGHKSMGMLLPREKEHWQTGLELVLRLKEKDKERALTETELASIAERLAVLVEASVPSLDGLTATYEECPRLDAVAPTRPAFLIRALGLTEQPSAVGPLIHVAERGVEPYAMLAIQQLGNLHGVVGAKSSIPAIIDTLESSSCPEALLTACTSLSVIADAGDPAAIDALAGVRLRHDGDVEWAAALALARLGSDKGKSTLLDLLDRSFWRSGDRYRVVDESGVVRRYAMPASRVEALLLAAIDAASNLSDEELWNAIEQLRSDESPSVRRRAQAAVQARS